MSNHEEIPLLPIEEISGPQYFQNMKNRLARDIPKIGGVIYLCLGDPADGFYAAGAAQIVDMDSEPDDKDLLRFSIKYRVETDEGITDECDDFWLDFVDFLFDEPVYKEGSGSGYLLAGRPEDLDLELINIVDAGTPVVA